MEKSWEKQSQKKVVKPNRLHDFASKLKKEGKTLATINGSFDLLHAGHLQILYEASLQCDCLIVGLNSDISIKRYKSIHRPIVPLEYRIQMMSALSFVDYVTWFDESDPCSFITKVTPDVHVNGAEYGPNCLEAGLVKNLGGRLFIVELIAGLSTSNIVERVKQCD